MSPRTVRRTHGLVNGVNIHQAVRTLYSPRTHLTYSTLCVFSHLVNFRNFAYVQYVCWNGCCVAF